MRILFDQGTPIPLRQYLPKHQVETAFERGWAQFSNGDLIAAAEKDFDVLVTTDKNLRHQQSLVGRKLAIVVLPTTSWPRLRDQVGTNRRKALGNQAWPVSGDRNPSEAMIVKQLRSPGRLRPR